MISPFLMVLLNNICLYITIIIYTHLSLYYPSLLHISIKSLSLKSAILPQRYSNIVVIFRYTYHYPYFDIRPAITVMSSATASREISTLGSSLRAVPWTQVSWALFFQKPWGNGINSNGELRGIESSLNSNGKLDSTAIRIIQAER